MHSSANIRAAFNSCSGISRGRKDDLILQLIAIKLRALLLARKIPSLDLLWRSAFYTHSSKKRIKAQLVPLEGSCDARFTLVGPLTILRIR